MFPAGPNIPRHELLPIYFENPFKFLVECFEKYGDIFSLNLGNFQLESTDKYADSQWVFLTKPEHLKAMFAADPEQLRSGEGHRILFGEILPPKGLLSLDGKEHSKRKRLLLKYFQGERIAVYTEVMSTIAQETVKDWFEQKNFPLFEQMQSITQATMVNTIFGVTDNKQLQQICYQLRQIESSETTLEEKIKINSYIAKFLLEIIKNYYQIPSDKKQPTNNILEVLLASREEPSQSLSDEEIRDEILTLLDAGFDTTSTTLSWVFECILNNPEVYKKLKKELDENIVKLPIEPENLSSLHYLEAVIRETLRLRAINPIAGVRLLKSSWDIDFYTLPANTIVANCQYLLHTRSELYPEPHKFQPERFEQVKPDPNSWTPFGGGVRTCLGMAFALHEMKIVLATVLSMVRLELAKPVTKPVLEGSFYIPEGGLPVRVVERFY